MQADSQKLIAYGKVLEDDTKSLKDYSIKEGDFLVVMVSKVRLLIDFMLICIAQASCQARRGSTSCSGPTCCTSSASSVSARVSTRLATRTNYDHICCCRWTARSCSYSRVGGCN